MAAKRFKGGYKSSSARPEKSQPPLLAIACEGETEARYIKHLNRNHRHVRIRPKDFRGHHGKQLVDDVIDLEQELLSKSRDPTPLIHKGVIFDLENHTTQTIAKAKEAVLYAAAKDVNVWISFPVIERWFLLHHKHINHTRSKNVIRRNLESHLKNSRLPRYKKPGDIRFYRDLLLRSDFATTMCVATHSEDLDEAGLTCICQFPPFLSGLRGN